MNITPLQSYVIRLYGKINNQTKYVRSIGYSCTNFHYRFYANFKAPTTFDLSYIFTNRYLPKMLYKMKEKMSH